MTKNGAVAAHCQARVVRQKSSTCMNEMLRRRRVTPCKDHCAWFFGVESPRIKARLPRVNCAFPQPFALSTLTTLVTFLHGLVCSIAQLLYETA